MISDKEHVAELKSVLPTGLVDRRLAFGGLQYATVECFCLFAIIKFIYSTIATHDNFIFCGGKLLREIWEGIICNLSLHNIFIALCNTNEINKNNM